MIASQWQQAFPFLSCLQADINRLLEKYPQQSDLNLSQDWQWFEQQNKSLDVFKKLRIYRKTRLALIASLDELGCGSSHLWAMHRTSELAILMVQQAYRYCRKELNKKYGQVISPEGYPVSLQVFALGKLGTGELNYSSDLDLVFVYEHGGLSNGSRTLEAQPYFERFGRRLIQLLDQFTADGQVYRIDMRLRPFGSASPIVCSNEALSQYIINEGREWERFAWMRSHTVAGNIASGRAMLQEIKPFIYRKHLDYSVFESLARIKREMSADLPNHQSDLKLGEGGIREIEFIVQSLQVTFGGRIELLQGRAIFPQFKQLQNKQKIPAKQAQKLQQAWLFLRKLENLCQLQNDQQTHKLPTDKQQLESFALLMGFNCWNSCYQQLNSHQQFVQQQFSELFEQEQTTQTKLNQSQIITIKNIIKQHFHTKIAQTHVDKVRQLLERAFTIGDPLLCQQRLLPILKAISKRPSYILMLIQEQSLLPKLLKLLQKSEYFSHTISRFPALLELFFEPENMLEPIDQRWLQQQWDSHKNWPDLDAEQWAENIRYFKQKIQFKLIQAQQQQQLHDRSLRHAFCSLAEFLLSKVVQQSHQETRLKHKSSTIKAGLLQIIAYGSLGVKNMHQDSDLDIVFIVDLPRINSDQRLFLQRWIKRIISQLNTTMYHGDLYQVDLQLRPNGNSGAMVTTISEFTRYQQQQAWLWEHAALIKARLLNSPPNENWLDQLRTKLLCRPKTKQQIDQAFEKIEQKMQQQGKETHHQELKLLEKILQLASQKPELLRFSDYSELLEKAQQEQLITHIQAKQLLNNKHHIR